MEENNEAELQEYQTEEQVLEADPRLSMAEIAELAHNCVWSYLTALNKITDEEPWMFLTEDQRTQRTELVHKIIMSAANPSHDSFCRDEHDDWLMEHLLDGWRFGLKDLVAKTHPNLLPYDRLANTERVRYTLFRAVTKGLLPVWAGF